MSTNVRIDEKGDELIDLFAQPNIKGENKFMVCFKFFVVISDKLDALFVFNLFISFSFLKRKSKIAFNEDCFGTWMLLIYGYCS